MVIDPLVRRMFERAPEREEAKRERATNMMLSALLEEE
jgi:hypothetical protein